MKRLLLFSALLAITASASFGQNHRVLIEENTGTWCGWCIRGLAYFDSLEALHPNRYVGVVIHNSDPMQVEMGPIMEAGFPAWPGQTKVPGFPNSWVSRTVFNGAWNLDPGSWTSASNNMAADQLLQQPDQALIHLSNIGFDPTTHMVTAKTTVTFQKPMTGDFRITIYVTEDGLSGAKGTSWDQTNYYYALTYTSGPNIGDPVLPAWYQRGTAVSSSTSHVSGLVYNNVLRGTGTDLWGAQGIIPSSVTAGAQYSKTFTFPLPPSVKDVRNVNIVAFVNQIDRSDITKNQVFDVEKAPLGASAVTEWDSPFQISSTGASYAKVDPSATTDFEFQISNQDDEDLTYQLAIDPMGWLPKGWSVALDKNTVTVPAHKFATFNAKVTTGADADIGSTYIMAYPIKQGQYAVPSSGTSFETPLYFLSNNARVAVYTSEPPVMAGMPDSLKSATVYMPFTDQIVYSYPVTDFDFLVLDNLNVIDWAGSSNPGYPPMAANINLMLQNGKKVFLSSYPGLYLAFEAAGDYATSDVTDLFSTLGVEYDRHLQRWVNNSDGTSTWKPFDIQATADPLAGGKDLRHQGGTYTSHFNLTSDSKSVPFYYFDKQQNVTTKGGGPAAFHYMDESTGGKLVYLGFDFGHLTNQTDAAALFERSMNWLAAPTAGVADKRTMDKEGMFATANPFEGRTEIRYTPKADEANVTFTAYDVLGNEVAKMPSKLTNGSFTATFDASTLAAGTYTVVAHSSTGAHQIRVVSK